MFVYRPVAFEDQRFPDGRGLLLAWSIQLGQGPDGLDRGLFLVMSGGRFFLCGSVPERHGLLGFLELDPDLARRQYHRMEKYLLPFPDTLVDHAVDIPPDHPVRTRSANNAWRAR